MMKKTIKLLMLTGALLSVGAMAAKSTTFNFSYPDYFYIFTNLSTETFDFTAAGAGSNPGKAKNTNVATKSNLDSCLDTLLNHPPSSVTAQNSAGTDQISGSCPFVATDTTTNNDFTVHWNNLDDAEGAILVATNKTSWAVAAKVTDDFDNVSNFVKLQLRTDSNNYSDIGTTAVNIGVLNGGTLTNAYYTNYANIYVVPLLYKMVLTNPLAIPKIASGSPDTAVVTYEAGTP